MKPVTALRELGPTRHKLMRVLLAAPQGATVENLCDALRVSHNAVRQHLTALLGQGLIARAESIPSGGRPRACFVLLPAGRELFPRNYALMARGLLEYQYAQGGVAAVQSMLAAMGAKLGADAAERIATAGDNAEVVRLLAEQLDAPPMLNQKPLAMPRPQSLPGSGDFQ